MQLSRTQVRWNPPGHRPRFPARLGNACLAVLLPVAAQAAAPDNTALRAAGYLEAVAVPACAAVRVLADQQQGLLNDDSAAGILGWIDSYGQQNVFNRANLLSQLLDRRWNADRRNTHWLRQAQVMLQRGETANVEHALRRLRDPLDDQAALARHSLSGTVLLQQRRFAEAAAALEPVAGDSSATVFDRYNLALALTGQGHRADEGRKLLDELGQLPAEDTLGLALRDRINLALGWSWLAANKGGTARPYFRRVRLEGPYSNRALLGMGWAELAPNGGPQFAAVVMGFYHEFPFEPAIQGPGRFQRALIPWRTLEQRAVHEPPVQEALLAIAYALAQLRQADEAATAYRHAIRQYQAERARLEQLATTLRDSSADPRRLIEQHARPGEFTAVRASTVFARIEDELRVLQHCRDELEDIRYTVEPFQQALRARLDHQEQAMDLAQSRLLDELRRLFLADAAVRRVRVKGYLAQALFALAVLQDRRGGN